MALFLTLFAVTPENMTDNQSGSNLSEFVPVDQMLNITENFTPAGNGTVEEFVDVDESLENEAFAEENASEDVFIPEENVTEETIVPEENETQETIPPEENITEEIPAEEFIPVDECLNQTNATQEEIPEEIITAPSWPGLESALASLSDENYSFSGDYAEVSEAEIYPGNGSFSAQAWIRTSDTSDGIALSTGEYGAVESYWSMGKSWAGELAPLYIRINDGSGGEIFGWGTINLADGKWHHIIFVRDGARKKVFGYVDGALDLEFEDTTGAISDANTALMLGNSNPNQGEWFDGEIAGFGTFRAAFSPDEVRALYSTQAGEYGEN